MRKSITILSTILITVLFRFSASRILQEGQAFKPRCNLASAGSRCGRSNSRYFCPIRSPYCTLGGQCEKSIPSGNTYDVSYSYGRYQSHCKQEVVDLGGAILSLAICFGWVLPLVYFSCFACFARDERIGDRFKDIPICIVLLLWLFPVVLMIIHVCRRGNITQPGNTRQRRRPTAQEIEQQHNALNNSQVEYNQAPSDEARRNSAPFIVGRAFRSETQNARMSGKIQPISPRVLLQPVLPEAPKFENPFVAIDGEHGLGYPVDSPIMKPWQLPQGAIKHPTISVNDLEVQGSIRETEFINEGKDMDQLRRSSVVGAVVQRGDRSISGVQIFGVQ